MCVANELGLDGELIHLMDSLTKVLYVDKDNQLTYPRQCGWDSQPRIIYDCSELADSTCIGEYTWRHDMITTRLLDCRRIFKIVSTDETSCLDQIKTARLNWISNQMRRAKTTHNAILWRVESQVRQSGENDSGCHQCCYIRLGCLVAHLGTGGLTHLPGTASSPALLPFPCHKEYFWSVLDLQKHLVEAKSRIELYEECSHGFAKPSSKMTLQLGGPGFPDETMMRYFKSSVKSRWSRRQEADKTPS